MKRQGAIDVQQIELNGSYEIVCNGIEKIVGINSKSAQKILDYLIENKDKPDKDYELECFSYRYYSNLPPGSLALMTSKYNYYINIKKTTVIIIALILDITITKGASSALINMHGISGPCVVKLNERNGEKCIVKETVFSKNRIGSVDVLQKFKGECCNCDMDCKYNKGDQCGCTKEDVREIYNNLTHIGLFKKAGEYFVYQ